MDMFVVRGGRRLQGSIRVSGAKNSALPIMAASLMAEGPLVLRDVPELVDVNTLASLLRSLGVEVERRADRSLSLTVTDRTPYIADYELVRRMRASICVLGPLLARRGKACVSLPGGCNIGDRPIDLHLKGLQALGADIRVERGYVIARAGCLRGARIFLGGSMGSTVTGTCNVMAAAALADGVTIIESAACEPEVIDFGTVLNAMGARIEGLGTPTLRIEGVEELAGAEHQIIPDRIEATTLLMAGAITGGQICVENVCPTHMSAILDRMAAIGIPMEIDEDPIDPLRGAIQVSAPNTIRAVEVSALPYPGLPTDVQAQFMALLTLANGISVVTDKVFPDRFMHVPELVRLGASIHREGPSAIINGVAGLRGACVMASDLRASAALVLGALAAEGETVIRRIYHLDRGYELFEQRLNALGADIQRVEDTEANVPCSLRLTELVTSPASLEELFANETRQVRIDQPQAAPAPALRSTSIRERN
jgi:UDP-N-acetylglucosamine 1-carboxyvinyltransferase